LATAGTSEPVHVIYDGECAFCRRSVERIRRLDRRDRFEYVPSQSPDLLARFPQLARHDLNSGMRVVLPGGTAHAGADAVYQIARRLPRTAWFAWLYRVPGARWLARRAYAWVAARRHRFALQCDDSCRADGPPRDPESRRSGSAHPR